LLQRRATAFLQNRFARIIYFLGRCLLAGVFLWSGLTKAFQSGEFSETVGAYGLLPDPLVFPAAIFLILAELVVGIGLLIDRRGALTANSLLMLLFMAVLGYKNVYRYLGGIFAWKAADYEIGKVK
jgi:uncharacterized membrane protein YphA (DoxX/SURF4 family)